MNRKRGVFLITCLMCSLLLMACGKQKEVETESFYREEIQHFSEMIDDKELDTYDIIGMTYRNGKACFALEGYVEEEIQRFIYQVEDEVSEQIEFSMEGESVLESFDVSSNGNFCLLEERYNEATDTISKYLLIFDAEGHVLSEQETQQWIGSNDIVKDIKIGANNEIYLFCDSGIICVLDESGEWQYTIESHEDESILEVNRTKDDGVIFVSAKYSGDEENLSVYQIRYDDKSTELVTRLEEDTYSTDILINGMGQYDFYLRNSQYISGYSIDEKIAVPIMRWEENEFVSDWTGTICAMSEEQWIAEERNGQSTLVYMKKGESQTIVEKEKLQLACVYSNSTLQKQVADFNSQNDQYYIEVISYDEKEKPYQAFLMDLTAGKDMDIIVLPAENQEALLAKGLLEDLYPFIEEDSELSKEDFLPNVLSAYEQDGKLYHTISRVNISGWITKKSYMGEDNSWNQEVFKSLLEEHPDAVLFKEASGKKILSEFLEGMLVSFVNWKDGTCQMQSDYFDNMLDVAQKYGQEEAEVPTEEIIQNIREERLIFSETVINPYEIQLYNEALDGNFTVVGTPFADDTGCTFWASDIQCGISVNSENKQGAWQFVREYFTEEYQDLSENVILFGVSDEGIPVRKDCFEEFVKRYTATESYEKDGQWIEPVQGNAGTSVFDYEMYPMTTEQEKIFRDIVTGTTQKKQTDEQINQIILEEAEAYFTGEKSLDETVELIQNRIETYVNEQR